MRYMLNEATAEKVLLEKEIEYIKSFIAIQSLRFSENDFVKFDVTGNVDGIEIAPLVLIPFVENAFKHGDKTQKPPVIEIYLEISRNSLNFKVINYIRKIKSSEIEENSGFGLENLNRRLELSYPDKYKLDVISDKNQYTIKLKLDLYHDN